MSQFAEGLEILLKPISPSFQLLPPEAGLICELNKDGVAFSLIHWSVWIKKKIQIFQIHPLELKTVFTFTSPKKEKKTLF